MKKLSLLLLMFTLLANVNGQYTPMLKTGNQWNVLIEVENNKYTEIFKISTDTIIDTKLCKIVETYIDSAQNATSVYRQYFFEDTIAQKIYTYEAQNSQFIQKLFFDFNAVVGDTLMLDSPGYGLSTCDTFIVSSISDILINSSNRKKITLNYLSNNIQSPNSDTWIEGVGSIRGLIYGSAPPIIHPAYQFNLLCMSTNNQQMYQNPNYSQCYMSTVEIDEIPKNSASIYPNPVINNEFWIKSNTLSFSTAVAVELFDIYGKLVMKTSVDINQNPISTANLPKGVYFYKITNELKQMGFGKIIVL